MLASRTTTGGKVLINPPPGTEKHYPSFCKAFAGMKGTLIRRIPFNHLYPGDFAHIGIGKLVDNKYESILIVDENWLTQAS